VVGVYSDLKKKGEDIGWKGLPKREVRCAIPDSKDRGCTAAGSLTGKSLSQNTTLVLLGKGGKRRKGGKSLSKQKGGWS